jgi:glycogen synthase
MSSRPASSRDRLRVLMTTDAVGGVWQYSLDLTRGLVQRGIQVLLATLGPHPNAEQKRQALEIDGASLVEGDFALEWMTNPWAGVDAAGEWLLDLQLRFGADVIHLNGYSHAACEWRKPVVAMAHSCVCSWWQAVHGCAPGPEWHEYRRRVSAGLAAADAVVAPSAFMAAEMTNYYGVPSEKVRVIHNFTRTRRFSGEVKQEVILAAGRLWDEAKNVAILDSIAPQLDWKIRLAGSASGPGDRRVRANNVQLLGNLPHRELMQQMSRAAIFAHSALYEPFGLSVLEAARVGCCLVLSAIPSLQELWEGAAVFIDPRDPDAWTRELNALARNWRRREELGQLARARAHKYSAASSLHKYRKLYNSLIYSAPAGKEAAA